MKLGRWLELAGIFVVLPVLLAMFSHYSLRYLMPLLAVVGLLCLLYLLRDKQFKRKRLWRIKGASAHVLNAIKLFLPLAMVITFLVYWFLPDNFLDLPQQHTQLWLTTILIYPLISVLPQELIFRSFFFHRYKPIVPDKQHRWWLSSGVFALAHVVYGNWLAVIGSVFAGLLFGYRYIQSKSTLVVALEHSLWGCFAFTVGLGGFFLSQSLN